MDANSQALVTVLKEELQPLRSDLSEVTKGLIRVEEQLAHQKSDREYSNQRHAELELRVRDVEHSLPPELSKRLNLLEQSEASRRTRDALVVAGITLVVTLGANLVLEFFKSGVA